MTSTNQISSSFKISEVPQTLPVKSEVLPNTIHDATHRLATPLLGQQSETKSPRIEVKGSVPPPLTEFDPVSIELGKLSLSSPKKEKLTLQQRESLEQAIYAEWNVIMEKKPTKQIPIFYQGHHMTVFEHADFPGHVMKLVSLKKAEEMLKSVNLAQKEGAHLDACYIPSTEIVPLPNSPLEEVEKQALFVMDKVEDGLSHWEAEEASEREYEQFEQHPEKEAVWKNYFRQAAELTCVIGYWDMGWANMLLTKKGFAFIDFERISPTSQNRITGLSRLLRCAPPQFFQMISDCAQKYAIEPKKVFQQFFETENIEAAKEMRSKQLAHHSKVRQWHQEQGIEQTGPLKIEDFSVDSMERKIIEKYNQDFPRQIPLYKGSLIMQRHVHWQLFFLPIFKQ